MEAYGGWEGEGGRWKIWRLEHDVRARVSIEALSDDKARNIHVETFAYVNL